MRTALLTLFCLAAFTPAFAQVAALRWDVQQDRPVATDIFIYQGETVDLIPRLVQGTTPVGITNAAVSFLYREPSLTEGTYRTVAAANPAIGTLSLRWTPDLDAGAQVYEYQFLVGSNTVNPRVHGHIMMRPTLGVPPSSALPPAVAGYATPADLQSISNALASAFLPIAFPATGTVHRALSATQSATVTGSQSNALTQATAAIAAHVPYHGATAEGGFAGGSTSASTQTGGAIGKGAKSQAGGAIGENAATGDGFAGGKNAYALGLGFSPLDTIQLGAGVNRTPRTLQIYDHRLMNADGSVPQVQAHETNATTHADIRQSIAPAATNAAAPMIAAHNTAPTSHADIRQAIADIEAQPGRVLEGNIQIKRWQMWDWGYSTNRYIILTNDVFEIWE